MRNIFIFTELSNDSAMTPSKIGNLYLNRFIIDESAAFEVLGVHDVEQVWERTGDVYKFSEGIKITILFFCDIGNPFYYCLDNKIHKLLYIVFALKLTISQK